MSVPPPDIFVGYAREDEAWVRPLVAELQRHGRTVFWDRRIPAGKDWRSHIGTALEAARCVVVLWSEHSSVSPFVLEEADEGKARNLLEPILRHRVRIPLGFRNIHAADLSEWSMGEVSDAFETFIADLSDLLGAVAPASTEREAKPAHPAPAGRQSSEPSTADMGASPARPRQRRTRNQPLESEPVAADAPTVHARAGIAAATPRPEPATPDRRATFRPRLIAAGQVFRDVDAPWCPELVVIPAGSFTMGSPVGGWFRSGDERRSDDEGPQRAVTLSRAFAMGRFPITRGQFDGFVAETGHDMSGGAYFWPPEEGGFLANRGWRSPGFAQTDSHPVVCVSWLDAQAYMAWLSEKTGAVYRLPTEAEWEYAARGGTTTPFWTGATISTAQANYNGNCVYGSGVKGVYREATVTVDDPSFAANAFGLYHVLGNVSEWVQDCYADSYDGASGDGQFPVDRNDSADHVLRGGSWISDPWELRSASRYRFEPAVRLNYAGFRVARMLTL